jgi:uncharacterized protein with HEPN domain
MQNIRISYCQLSNAPAAHPTAIGSTFASQSQRKATRETNAVFELTKKLAHESQFQIIAKSCDGDKHLVATLKIIEAHSNVSFDAVCQALEMYIRLYAFLKVMRNHLSHHLISLNTRIVWSISLCGSDS